MKLEINQIIRKLIIKYPSFANIISNLEFLENEEVKTAATNGNVVYYAPSFLQELKEGQQLFLIAHEICHIALNHINRAKNKNKKLWNIATDAVINANLVKDGLEEIEGGVHIDGAIDYDAEELYEIIKEKNPEESNPQQAKNQKNEKMLGDQKEDENNGQKQDIEIDPSMLDKDFSSHEMWDDAIEKDENEEVSEKDIFKKNQEQKEKNMEELKKQLEEKSAPIKSLSTSPGNFSNGSSFEIGEVGEAQKVIDWKKLLKGYLEKNNPDWKLGRKVRYGVVPYALTPATNKPTTEVLLDTSGSIEDELLRGFLTELKSIIKDSNIKVGCFDTNFYGFTEIKSSRDIDKMEFRGRGGTDFEIAVKSFSKDAVNRIIFTDGFAEDPHTSCNAIWIVFPFYGTTPKINPPGGKVINLTQDQYNKICRRNQNYEH